MTSGVTAAGLAPGELVCGQYVVERFIRRGPLASVFVAKVGDKRFSVRMVHTPAGAPPVSPDRVAIVTRVLESVAELRHPAIPALIAVGAEPAGLVVVTGHPGGMTLRDVIARGARLRPGDVARVMTEAASPLDRLHGMASPMVHRTLAPDAVVVSERPVHVWVEDCGLAHALATAGFLQRELPTPTEYRSPDELLQCIQPRTDVFGLASVAFECLTGTAAFRGPTQAAVEAAILRGPRPSIRLARPDLPDAVDDVLARAWSTDAAQGYPTPGAFASDFARALATESQRVVAPTAVPRVSSARSSGAPDDRAPPVLPSDEDVDRAFDEMLGDGSSGPARSPSPAIVSSSPPLPSSVRSGSGSPAGARPSSTPPAPPAAARAIRGTLLGVAPLSRTAGAASAGLPGSVVGSVVSTMHGHVGKPPGTTQRVPVPRIRPLVAPADILQQVPLSSPPRPSLDTWEPAEGTRPRPQGEGGSQSSPPALPASGGAREPGSAPDLVDAVPLESIDMVVSDEAAASMGLDATSPVDGHAVAPPPLPVAVDLPVPSNPPSNPPSTDVATPSVRPPPPDGVPSTPPLLPDPTPWPASGTEALPLASTPAIVAPPAVPWLPTEVPASNAESRQPLSSVVVQPAAPPWSGRGAVTPRGADAAGTAPLALRIARIMGPFILLATVVMVGGQMYVATIARDVALLQASRPASGVHSLHGSLAAPTGIPGGTGRTVEALPAGLHPAPAGADAGLGSGSDAVVAVVADGGHGGLALASDAAMSPGEPDAAPSVATGSDGGISVVARVPGAEALPRHPRGRDVDRVWDEIEPRVQGCVGREHTRHHVRVVVSYTGEGGAVTEVHVAPPFAAAPLGTCIEAAVRASPMPAFRDATWEETYVFDLD